MFEDRVTRRRLLVVVPPALAAVLAACGSPPAPTAAPAKPTEAPKPAAEPTKPAAAATTAPTAAPAAAATSAPAPATSAPAVATTAPATAAGATPAAAAKPAGAAPVKLVWWSFSFGQPGADAMNKQILPEYMRQFPNAQVTYEYVMTEKMGERELAGFAAGNMADIWEPYSEAIPDVARTGRSVPIDPYLADSKLVAKDDFSKGTQNYLTINGKFWALPYRVDVRGWFYRKSHLDAKNIKVPTELTWEQNVQLARDLTVREGSRLVRAGHAPWGSQILMTQEFVELLWQAGGEVLSPDYSKATFASPEGEKALQQLIDLHKAVYPSPDAGLEQSPVPYFAAGKLSQYWFTPTVRGQMMQYAKDDYKDVVLVKQPSKGPAGRLVALMFASSWALSPRGQAKNSDAAWHALEWVAGNPEQVEKFLLSGGLLPASQKVATRPVFKEDPILSGMDEIQSKYGRQMTPWPRTFELYAIMGDKLTEVWLGKSKAKDALESAQKSWTELIAKAG
jgi:multiple sugar transport system substrate-binding protein